MLCSGHCYISSLQYGDIYLARFLITPVKDMIMDSSTSFLKNT